MTLTTSGPDAPIAPPSLALRIERVIRDSGLTLTRSRRAAGGGEAAFDEEGSRFNRIYGLGLEGPCTEEALKSLVDWMAERGALQPIVETSPAAHPGAEAALRSLGFEISDRLEVLVRRLDAPLPPPAIPSAVRIEALTAPDEVRLRAFVQLMHHGFHPEATSITGRALLDGMRAARNEGVDLFVAALGEREIGAAQALSREGITILFGASVLEPERRQGAQQALLRARLERARCRGSEWAAVFCEPGAATYRNAERLGFSRVYTRLQWKAPGG